MLKIEKEGNVYRVELSQVSKINFHITGRVKEQLSELISEPGYEIILNLQEVRFIDSEGFRVLLDINEGAAMNNCLFKLYNVGHDVRELIIMLDLEGTFTFVSGEDTREKILLVLD